MADYVGVIDERPDVRGVHIADLPGCYGAGASAEDAIADAASAAREWIEQQASGAGTLPKARATARFSRPRISTLPGGGEAAVIIPVMIDDGRTVRATLHSTLACCAT